MSIILGSTEKCSPFHFYKSKGVWTSEFNSRFHYKVEDKHPDSRFERIILLVNVSVPKYNALFSYAIQHQFEAIQITNLVITLEGQTPSCSDILSICC